MMHRRVRTPFTVSLLRGSGDAMRSLTSIAGTVSVLWCALAVAAPAQSFKILINFDGTDGSAPVYTALVQSTDGNLYGTTLSGGVNGLGTAFKISQSGVLTTIYSFCSALNCTDGSGLYAGLVRGIDGNFYGTTSGGGTFGDGAVFKLTPTGTVTTLHSFDFSAGEGDQPFAALIQAADGWFYGSTAGGGPSNAGAIFKVTSSGVLTFLHFFGGIDGATPMTAIVQGNDGNFYGTAGQTVFQMTPTGVMTTLYTFSGPDGAYPNALIKAANGNFYGTTYGGGANNTCNNGCGTVFEISAKGNLTTLYSFDSTHGANPISALSQATDANLYGTTYAGGTGGDWGTAFKITPSGILTSLHSFDLSDGGQPYGSVTQATNGTFYGTVTNGGADNGGTLFSLSTGLRPFVETIPTSGTIGAAVIVLGSNLFGATKVTFNGIEAVFTQSSGFAIRATVPAGATTGEVIVTTPSGTLKSNLIFRVKP